MSVSPKMKRSIRNAFRMSTGNLVGFCIVVYVLIMSISWNRFRSSMLVQDHGRKIPLEHIVKSYSNKQISTSSKPSANKMVKKSRTVAFDKESAKPLLVIDMISIGSLSRIEYQVTQRRTFASHKSVRFFFNITEEDDHPPDCAERLQLEGAMRVSHYCKTRKQWNEGSQSLMRHWSGAYASPRWLRKKASPQGWICAQNRPTMGFAKAIEKYRTMANSANIWSDALPDYLIITDDDTYLNLEQIHQYLVNKSLPVYFHDNQRNNTFSDTIDTYSLPHPIHSQQQIQQQPQVVVGCVIRSPVNVINMTAPFGGFGIIMSKAAIYNYMRPIQCPEDHVLSTKTKRNAASSSQPEDYRHNITYDANTDATDAGFAVRACDRIQENLIEERALFRNGMSLSDLQLSYVKDEPYTRVRKWRRGQCLHSDWLWGYFINTYNVSKHTNDPLYATVPQDRLEAYQSSGGGDVCNNQGTNCDASSHICHYQNSSQMEELTAFAKEQFPKRYR